MYHNHHPEFFASGDHLGGPSQTTAITYAAGGLELDFHGQFGLDANHCFDTYPPPADLFFDDGLLPPQHQQQQQQQPDSDSVVSTVFYDPSSSVQFDLPSFYSSMPGNIDLLEIPQVSYKRQKKASFKQAVEDGGSFKKEKQRRERLTEKFEELKSLIPNRTKDDRATIVSDTIDYIMELGRTVGEYRLLVEKKRRGKGRMADMVGDMESSTVKPSVDDGGEYPIKGALRSSWLRRKSKETYVDVRIVEDEVTIKLTQRKKMSCLVVLSRVLDELQLELLHLSGGVIGDCSIYMFNTKIHEGSSVYASAVANKLIEAMDVHCSPQFVC